MSSRRVISNTLNVNTVDDGEIYNIEWSDAFGVINNIICYNNGWAKYKPNGGAGEWIRATLYHKEGSGVSQAVQCYEIYLRAYLSDGTQVTSGGWPKHVYTTNHIALEGYDEDSSHVSYKAEFYDLNHNLIGTYSIGKTIDGASAPEYNKEYYAWSNQVSTSGVGVEPAPNSGWQTSIASQGDYGYLWKKIVRYTYNIASNSYTANSPQYYRMNGENGTSIRTKGSSVAVVIDIYSYVQDLPSASSYSDGTYAYVRYDQYNKHIYKVVSSSWVAQDYNVVNDDIILKIATSTPYKYSNGSLNTQTAASDGDAYPSKIDGHFWQWSAEASKWLDLGQFKGEAGVTYYTHIAWADGVTFLGTPSEPAEGCLNKRNVVANSVIGGTTTPPTSSSASKPYMGIRIDTIAGADSTEYETYTWEKVQGAQGERGKTGKFYYYGGVFDPQNSTKPFIVNDANTPYFKYTSGTAINFWVYVKEVAEGNYTMSQMGTPSPSNADWKLMTDDFKYIISEAVFAEFANLGGFIMNDPWMISQTPTSDSPSQNIGDFHGDPLNDDFRPMYAVNGQTGAIYMQNAYVSGTINVKEWLTPVVRVTGGTEGSPQAIPLSSNPSSTYLVSGVATLPDAANHIGKRITIFFESDNTKVKKTTNFNTIMYVGYIKSSGSDARYSLDYLSGYASCMVELLATNMFGGNITVWYVVSQRGILNNGSIMLYPDGGVVI